MNEILHQLEDLFVGSIPTVILFLLVVVAYRVLVHGPLLKVLAERRERTLGAVEKAGAAAHGADAKAQEYEARLRAARVEIARQREARMQQWNRERANILADAKHSASERVREAKAQLDGEVAAARSVLEGNVELLAAQALRAIMPSVSEGSR